MPDVNEENDQSDRSKESSKKVDCPTPQHNVDKIKMKPAIGKGQNSFVVEWQMTKKGEPPVT